MGPTLPIAPALGSRSSSYQGSHHSYRLSRIPSRAPSRASSRAGSGRRSMLGSMLGADTPPSRLTSRPVSTVGSRANSPYRSAPPKPRVPVIRRSPVPSEDLPEPMAEPRGSNINLPQSSTAAPRNCYISLEEAQPCPINPSRVARYTRNVVIRRRDKDWTYKIAVQDRFTDPFVRHTSGMDSLPTS
ncbi:hypothetical protein NEOLEDRAFT_334513 [Neolentinus lepideus HHB14362 ss-1]|uniref:Uncharacterized protein n=1 Tax=Neolentinus lepideus HHB14362 ss-1 TaxID=1314782 RepID=A0A165SUL7_9AGAM|nr:hypothetical protein NEOLEDRAFT_334513 [Neolentinus lepideus HHB14362 ss-1]